MDWAQQETSIYQAGLLWIIFSVFNLIIIFNTFKKGYVRITLYNLLSLLILSIVFAPVMAFILVLNMQDNDEDDYLT